MVKSGSDKTVRFFAALIFSASVVAAAFFGMALYEVFCERRQAAERVERLAGEVESLRRRAEYQKNFHARFVNDDEFAARVIRETLGYSAEGEIIFKFDEKSFSPNAVKVERGGAPLR